MSKEELWTLMPMAGVLVLGIFFALAMPRRKRPDEPEEDEADDEDDEDDE